MLAVAVRFPGSTPTLTLEQIRDRFERVGQYLRKSSYEKARIEPTLAGWYDMPQPVEACKISPYNFKVDSQRVWWLVADALSAVRRDADLEKYDMMWIVVGVFARPGEGYGMICYAANPGMLSHGSLLRGGFRPRLA